MPNTRFCVHCKEDDENTSDIGVVFPPVPQDLVGDCPRCGEGIAVVYQNHTDKSFLLAVRLSQGADGLRAWIKLNFVSENYYTLFNTPDYYTNKLL